MKDEVKSEVTPPTSLHGRASVSAISLQLGQASLARVIIAPLRHCMGALASAQSPCGWVITHVTLSVFSETCMQEG